MFWTRKPIAERQDRPRSPDLFLTDYSVKRSCWHRPPGPPIQSMWRSRHHVLPAEATVSCLPTLYIARSAASPSRRTCGRCAAPILRRQGSADRLGECAPLTGAGSAWQAAPGPRGWGAVSMDSRLRSGRSWSRPLGHRSCAGARQRDGIPQQAVPPGRLVHAVQLARSC